MVSMYNLFSLLEELELSGVQVKFHSSEQFGVKADLFSAKKCNQIAKQL